MMLIPWLVVSVLIGVWLSIALVTKNRDLKQSKLDYERLHQARQTDLSEIGYRTSDIIHELWPNHLPWEIAQAIVRTGCYERHSITDLLSKACKEVKSRKCEVKVPVGLPDSPDELFLQDVRDELIRARAKHPDWKGFPALVEEVGEVAQAMLDKGHNEVIKESVQVAATALRMAVEEVVS